MVVISHYGLINFWGNQDITYLSFTHIYISQSIISITTNKSFHLFVSLTTKLPAIFMQRIITMATDRLMTSDYHLC